MGLYRPPRSPYWWIRCPRPGLPPLRESTKIPADALSATQRATNRALAETAYHARMGDLARARYALPAANPAPPLTLEQWATWHDTHVVAHFRGREQERERLATIRKALGHHALPDLTAAHLQEWVTARASKVAPRTVNRELDTLRAVLRSAVAHGHLKASPAARIRRLHTQTPVRRLLAPDEETRLLGALRRPDDRALLLMAIDTLCRLGDCLDLRWQDDRGTTLWIADPKRGDGYHVPVTARLRVALDAIRPAEPDPAAYAFAHRRRPVSDKRRRDGVSWMLRAACGRADIPYGRAAGGITWHWATRRTTATRLIQAGHDLATVQQAGHWRDASVVIGIYADADQARVRAAVEGLQDAPAAHQEHAPAETAQNRPETA